MKVHHPKREIKRIKKKEGEIEFVRYLDSEIGGEWELIRDYYGLPDVYHPFITLRISRIGSISEKVAPKR